MSSDLYESSFLHCHGASLIDIFLDKGSPRPTVIFAFESSKAFQELQQDYHTGEAVINAADYRRSMIELKRLMFDVIDSRSPLNKRTKSERRENNYDNRKHQAVY